MPPQRDGAGPPSGAKAPWRAAFPAPADAPAGLRDRLSEQSIAAGAHLFRQGDPAVAVFAVTAGTVRLQRHTADGRSVVIHRARAGESLAEAALYADTYHCDAVAEVPARVVVYPKAALLALLQADPAVARTITAALARQVQALRTRLELGNMRPARQRVLAYLELLADDSGAVAVERPLKDLASEIGLTHEAFYRALAALADSGEIERDGRRIRLRLPDRL